MTGLQEQSENTVHDLTIVAWLCREYSYGKNEIKPHDVTNSSDASSAKRNEEAHQVC